MDITSSIEHAALVSDFTEAVEYVNNNATGLPEPVQRRMFGLFSRAVHGMPPTSPPPGMDPVQLNAWRETASLDASAAMREYVSLLDTHEATWRELFEGADQHGDDTSELPAGLIEQLENSGLRKCSSDRPADDNPSPRTVCEAARLGRALERFLPEHVDEADEDGVTPLMHAVDAGCTAAVTALLGAHATVDAIDTDGSTALHYAALLGHLAAAEQLLAAGATKSTRDADGLTAAQIAEAEGHTELAKLLAAVPASGPSVSQPPA